MSDQPTPGPAGDMRVPEGEFAAPPDSTGGQEAGDPAGPNPRTLRAVRGTFAATLVLEALVVLLVPRTIAQFGDGLVGWKLGLLLGLAAVLVIAAGMLGRPWGLRLATALQLGLLACGLLTAAMFVLGAVFGGIWYFLLTVRRDLLGVRLL
jgi:Protein of unknown function (DUF4233)